MTLPQAVPPKGTVEVEIGYEGTVPLATTRLTRIGVPEGTAKHTDWDQIGKSFSAVRGVGYVAWYPVAVEAANLSDGNSVWDGLARWKTRESSSAAKFTLLHSGEGAPPLLLCNGRGGQRALKRISGGYGITTECSFDSL